MNEVLAAKLTSHLPSPADAETPISSPNKSPKVTDKENTSSDEELDVFTSRRRKGRIMNSDNESDHSEGDKGSENHIDKHTAATENNLNSIDASDDSSSDDLSIFKRKPLTRITNNSSTDEEDVPSKTRVTNKSSSSDNEGSSNKQDSPKRSPINIEDSRIKSKQNKMKAKFNSLLLSRDKERAEKRIDKIVNSSSSDSSDNDGGNEMFSIENIKKKIEDRNKTLKSTIYDPDTSDDEKAHAQEQNEKSGARYRQKSSHKPAARMSSKQAMENMKKIKSESNRMLREKEVSLPYHRPKALSLKDILARKTQATSVDGTAFSIKMNENKLQEYAKMLEERQKQMMELCKSESDDAESDHEDILNKEHSQKNDADLKDNNSQDIKEKDGDLDNEVTVIGNKIENTETTKEQEKMDISIANDDLFDSQVSEVNNLITNTNDQETDPTDPTVTTVDPKDDVHSKNNTEVDSQLISLHYSETERIDKNLECNIENKINKLGSGSQNNELGAESQDSNELSSEIKNNKLDTYSQHNELGTDSKINELDTESQTDEIGTENQNNKQGTDNKNNEKSTNELGTETNVENEVSNAASVEIDEANKTLNKEEENDHKKSKGEKDKPGDSVNSDELVSKDETNNSDDQDDAFNDFLDDDDEMDIDEIDRMIEDAEILEDPNKNTTDSPMLIRESYNPRLRPKLTGAPGMVIDLDGTDAAGPRKVSGIELLKQRFVYFSNLKTPEELQKQARNRINPGLKHQKLKHELEEQIAEQRSKEWSKRLEEEKQQQAELNAIRGEDSDVDDDQDIDKLDAKLEEQEVEEGVEVSEAESEPEENDVEIRDKPRERNALVDDEAEESEDEEVNEQEPQVKANNEENEDDDNEADIESGDDPSDDESSTDDEMETTKPKKGRIIKAFEDSDEEDVTVNKFKPEIDNIDKENVVNKNLVSELNDILSENTENADRKVNESVERSLNEDDDLQSAQLQKSVSEDIFTSQDTDPVINAAANQHLNKYINLKDAVKKPDDKLTVICETQPYDEGKFDEIVGMCSGTFSQNILNTQANTIEQTQNELTLTNTELNSDILQMCTGKFYDNQFVSQVADNSETKVNKDLLNDDIVIDSIVTKNLEIEKPVTKDLEIKIPEKDNLVIAKEIPKDDNLQSILDELNDPEFDEPKQNKFFTGSANDGSTKNNESNLSKKRFVIDSDDEGEGDKSENKVKKKKKKLEERALQISDDEDSEPEGEVEDEYESALEDIDEDNADRLIEYDSEENEVEITTKNLPKTKKKSKARDFFEQEAELTSEDEWVGSGDEDEAGLDRMEREEGDDEQFHQGALQKQLGKIHMREMLDQDKREVRMIQELLLEDGDLGGGHRQRKFRWKNADGVEEEIGSYIDDVTSTQEMEDEIESEEQWRRQSHERAMYLRQIMLQQKGNDLDIEGVSFNQSAASVKANVSAENVAVTNENAQIFGKKPSKDIPSPAKKPFSLLQHNARGSILSRGDGALARLAALATPLAGESSDDGPKATSLGPTSKRNFVFATVSPSADKPKITKRKAENIGTPNLMKKLKTDEKPARSAKTSLLDHLKG